MQIFTEYRCTLSADIRAGVPQGWVDPEQRLRRGLQWWGDRLPGGVRQRPLPTVPILRMHNGKIFSLL